MSKLSAINWISPARKRKVYSVVPTISITSKDFKSGAKMNTAPYWRFAANKAFMTKYYPSDPKIRKISIYVGGQGVLIDTKPGKDQPFFTFGKANYFTDQELIFTLFKYFNVPIKKSPEITTIQLHAKPFGQFDEKIIHELVYINQENPDTTQLAGLKGKMERDENFPEADKASKQTIRVEG